MLTEKQAINLLKRHSSSEKQFKAVLAHSAAVKNLSLRIAKRIKNKKIDMQFLKTAALLHDIGRFKCPPWRNSTFHGVEGARMLRKEGLLKHALVAERHLGSGITETEAKRLGLPVRGYLPKTIEEKIICYADNKVFDTKIKNIDAIIRRYKRFGKEAVDRTVKLHHELGKFIK